MDTGESEENEWIEIQNGEILACMWSTLIVLGDSVCCPVSGRACGDDSAYRSGYGL